MQELNAERKQKDVQAIHAQHLKDMEDVYNRMTVVEISRFSFIVTLVRAHMFEFFAVNLR